MFGKLEQDLMDRVRAEEDAHSRGDRGSDTLRFHLERVARLAVSLGRTEGLDEAPCRLAGLFHDAGKFADGSYHRGDRPEEEWSVDALRELAEEHSLDGALVKEVCDTIRELYRDDPDPSPLTKVLFDADNLDKLGALGVANYFTKLGLRGDTISEGMLYRLTVELTYAHHASRCLMTEEGRRRAARQGPETVEFIVKLLDDLRRDNLYDYQIVEVVHDDLPLQVVAPSACSCGAPLSRRIWEIEGIKCSEIHLQHSCKPCNFSREIRFCRPRLLV